MIGYTMEYFSDLIDEMFPLLIISGLIAGYSTILFWRPEYFMSLTIWDRVIQSVIIGFMEVNIGAFITKRLLQLFNRDNKIDQDYFEESVAIIFATTMSVSSYLLMFHIF